MSNNIRIRKNKLKGYWEKEGALIVKCHDVREPGLRFHTEEWGIRENVSNPKE